MIKFSKQVTKKLYDTLYKLQSKLEELVEEEGDDDEDGDDGYAFYEMLHSLNMNQPYGDQITTYREDYFLDNVWLRFNPKYSTINWKMEAESEYDEDKEGYFDMKWFDLTDDEIEKLVKERIESIRKEAKKNLDSTISILERRLEKFKELKEKY